MEGVGSIPPLTAFPGDVYFRHDLLPAQEWEEHSHPWGQLNYVSNGVMNLEIEGSRFLSPPQYAVWIPPFKRHFSYALHEVVYRSVYVSLEFSSCMPVEPCIVDVSRVLRAILDDLALRGVRIPLTDEDCRMAQVALDQIKNGKVYVAYLPYATSDDLNLILRSLYSEPGDKRTIKEIATQYYTTPRTIERKCQRELGISFSEWRTRCKFIAAIERLAGGLSVKSISYELGYESASSFIVMFKRITGKTPDKYRELSGVSRIEMQ